MQRLGFKESWEFLRETTNFVDDDAVFPDKLTPVGFDEPEGWLNIYKYPDISDSEEEDQPEQQEVWKLENLTMPCIFLCRCGVYRISFKNTFLADSSCCWNGFIDVDFTDADLSRCDLRSSEFENVVFVRADLTDADLRYSSFNHCDFSGAQMRGVKLTRLQAKELILSEEQCAAIAWQHNGGRPPKGG